MITIESSNEPDQNWNKRLLESLVSDTRFFMSKWLSLSKTEKDSSRTEAILPTTPGTNLATESMIQAAANSPPVSTKLPKEMVSSTNFSIRASIDS